MLIEVLCVCRRPPRWVAEQTAAYCKRLPREFSLSFTYVAPGADSATASARRRDEATRLLKRAGTSRALIALDEHGASTTSRQFAARLGRLRETQRELALVIGGADGLDESITGRALEQWSLSSLTLPHLLVQVVLAEQLYRAWSILDGHPYHRE